MLPLIEAINKEVLKSELTPEKFLRPTNKSNNEIYVVTSHNSPNVMLEIGRLREKAFRSWGGGTGNEIDVDAYDYSEKPYYQLIVWDPEENEIVGGYRFLFGKDVALNENGEPEFVMSHLFQYSKQFINENLPYTIELGRAFIQPAYQTSQKGTKSIFALDNLWDGLGALIHLAKEARYFIGKVTMYNSYPDVARELIYEYMFRFFPDREKLILPRNPVAIGNNIKTLATKLFTEKDKEANYKILQKTLRKENVNIPPLFNAYIGLTNTLRMFGSAIDPNFSSVYETGIMLTMSDIVETKRKRYIEPYIEYLKNVFSHETFSKIATHEPRPRRIYNFFQFE
ncbi:MAG TPA: GNAT family N-acetyltransferase [Paludibacteraceae bacterium]|nr:GNAT family N-acetyltransferase [Paludibacteraceae bacterium]